MVTGDRYVQGASIHEPLRGARCLGRAVVNLGAHLGHPRKGAQRIDLADEEPQEGGVGVEVLAPGALADSLYAHRRHRADALGQSLDDGCPRGRDGLP